MPALPAIAVGVAAIGTGYSIYAGERANKAFRRASAAETARNNLAAARQRREAIKEARRASADIAQSAETQGASMSSAAQGGQASVRSQLSGNLSFLDQYKFFSDQASEALGQASAFRARQQTADSVAAIGMTTFSNSDRIQNFFSKGKAAAGTSAG